MWIFLQLCMDIQILFYRWKWNSSIFCDNSRPALRAMTNSIFVSNCLLNLLMKMSNSFLRWINNNFFNRRATSSLTFFVSHHCLPSLSELSKYIRSCSGTTYHLRRWKLRSSSVSVMFIFVSVYWDTLELNIWRIEIWIRIRIVKNCCRCNFVTWKLIFLVLWKIMM